jgi:acetyl-CoA carboxylase, biotin carboxylase subunit
MSGSDDTCMIKKVLIACGGETAIRLVSKFAKANIRTVAVYTQEDFNSQHIQLADEAICIGTPLKSYNRLDRVISAAEISDVDAIHAGDGPLSADERFAEVCVECGIKLITDSDQGGFT